MPAPALVSRLATDTRLRWAHGAPRSHPAARTGHFRQHLHGRVSGSYTIALPLPPPCARAPVAPWTAATEERAAAERSHVWATWTQMERGAGLHLAPRRGGRSGGGWCVGRSVGRALIWGLRGARWLSSSGFVTRVTFFVESIEVIPPSTTGTHETCLTPPPFRYIVDVSELVPIMMVVAVPGYYKVQLSVYLPVRSPLLAHFFLAHSLLHTHTPPPPPPPACPGRTPSRRSSSSPPRVLRSA